MDIAKTPALLNEIKDKKPYLLDHQPIKEALANVFKSGQIPQPKQRTCKTELTKDLFELYHYVYWYRHQGMTLEAACMEACDKQRELLPDNWLKNSTDPIDASTTLEKKVARLDKIPSLSQKKSLVKDR